jgi:hypothetical protein
VQCSSGPADYLGTSGLNHLGCAGHHGRIDHLPWLIEMIRNLGAAGLPPPLVAALSMIPAVPVLTTGKRAVDNLLKAGVARGQQLVALNDGFSASWPGLPTR